MTWSSYRSDFVTGGYTLGTFNAFGATLSWDFQQLISRSAKQQAAALSAESVDLSVAWQEWQIAVVKPDTFMIVVVAPPAK